MVEFALFFIVFLMLSLGLMEFGLGVWTYSSITHAARAGARYAIVHGASNPIGDGDLTVTQVVQPKRYRRRWLQPHSSHHL